MPVYSKIQWEINAEKVQFEKIRDLKTKARLKNNFHWFVKKAVYCKFFYYLFSVVAFLGPALGAVLSGIEFASYKNAIMIFIMFLSSFSTFLLSLTGVGYKWKLYRDQTENIKRMLSLYEDDGSPDSEYKLKLAFEESLVKTHTIWLKSHREDKATPTLDNNANNTERSI